jgi:hypothetical protein
MSFFVRIIVGLVKNNSIPVLKSFMKAYRETTSGPRNSYYDSSNNNRSTGDMFNDFLSKANLVAPVVDKEMAMKILEIECRGKEIDSWQVLERYYVLYKKNQPEKGGISYIQNKVFVAKETLMK